MTKTISIFGATGSIGDSAFSLIDNSPEDYEIEVIAGHQNYEKLSQLAQKYRPKLVIADESNSTVDAPSGVQVLYGKQALIDAASRETDWALNAIIGAAGLPVSLALANSTKTLALANKESMVCGGALLKAQCVQNQTKLLPVDSEHSAIFQCLEGQDRSALARVILTASGGPFREFSLEQMETVTPQDALAHPVWNMGARITIDSASMFNKALEVIEAKELFDLSPAQIDVIVHPQSIIHSFVEFHDQGQLAQLGLPDMRHAIGYALGYPNRLPTQYDQLDLRKIQTLTFEAADEGRFPALRLARECLEVGGVSGAALNGAKEVALDRFIAGEIGFLDMARIVEQVLAEGDWNSPPEHLSVIEDADQRAREMAKDIGT